MAQVQPHLVVLDRLMREAKQRVDNQQARVKRLIVQGFATQGAEDALRNLQATLRLMQEVHGGRPHR